MVSHNPSFDIDKLYQNTTINVDLSGFIHIDFDKIGSEDKNKVEEAIHNIMETIKSMLIK